MYRILIISSWFTVQSTKQSGRRIGVAIVSASKIPVTPATYKKACSRDDNLVHTCTFCTRNVLLSSCHCFCGSIHHSPRQLTRQTNEFSVVLALLFAGCMIGRRCPFRSPPVGITERQRLMPMFADLGRVSSRRLPIREYFLFLHYPYCTIHIPPIVLLLMQP